MALSKESFFSTEDSGERHEPFAGIANLELREYLEAVDNGLAKEVFPLRYTYINAPSLTDTFGMDSRVEMVTFMRSLRMAGLVMPEPRRFEASGRINRAFFYDREQLQVAAAVYWTIIPQLSGEASGRFKAIDWDAVYEETLGYLKESPLAELLTKPGENTDQKAPAVLDTEKPVIESSMEEREVLRPEMLAFWNAEKLEEALHHLVRSNASRNVMPENIAEVILRINYPESTVWTTDHLERGVELTMGHLHRFPKVENLQELVDKIIALQEERQATRE
jgi:hypothetical protein